MIEALFENIKSRIIEELANAKSSVKVISAYFTDERLFDLLCGLAVRGIDVKLIIADELTNIADSNIDFKKFIDSRGKFYLANRNEVNTLVHHKFCVIDDRVVITGSYNWTRKAQDNKENIIITDIEKIVQAYKSEFENIEDNYSKQFNDWEEKIIYSSFVELDKITGGFHPNELICLVGKSGMGKTSFLIQVAYQVASKFSNPVGYVSSGLTSSQVSKRLLSAITGIDTQRLRNGKLEEYEWQILHEKTAGVENIPFYVQEGGDGIKELERHCKKLWYKGARLIVLDNVDYLLYHSRNEMDNERNRMVLGRIKNLTRLLRIPIIFATETDYNKDAFRYAGYRRPQLNQLGILNYYVDSVISMHREEYYGVLEDEEGQSLKGIVELDILKHITGETGGIRLYFEGPTGKFGEKIDDKGFIIPNVFPKEDDEEIPF
ncbi:MAG: DnaB-like helicase C-terminal domain-containing protein [Cyanobacteria bacterium J06649_11]